MAIGDPWFQYLGQSMNNDEAAWQAAMMTLQNQACGAGFGQQQVAQKKGVAPDTKPPQPPHLNPKLLLTRKG